MQTKLHTHFIPVWKEAPFLRFIIPLIFGIILQWYGQPGTRWLFVASVISIIAVFIIFFTRHRATASLGLILNALFVLAGCWLVRFNDKSKWNDHILNHVTKGSSVIATLQEPLVAKTKSYKAEASVEIIDSLGNKKSVAGHIIVYLKKDSAESMPALVYGSRILFTKPLQAISNAGNPGGFDYQRNAAFKGVYSQIFLKTGDYLADDSITCNGFTQSLFNAREFVLTAFKKYIPGNTEAGLAEALLIGYKDDLDKDLVEQYANTGVVHIIAISGMHLGLIYGLLLLLLKPLNRKKWGKLTSALLIIAALWFFSILTGAAPSITRSALMFTVIILGQVVDKKTSIYNSLAISAFVLLLYNPFNLWDVGFQLSYAALLSIAVFGKFVTNLFISTNKILIHVWQLVAVTLAAQIITLPLVIYHFHQFPLSFLISNIIAVPLSSIILYGLLLLLVTFWLPVVASALGWFLYYAILWMNNFIAWVSTLPYSRIDEIYYTIPQTILLMLCIAAIGWWLLRKTSWAFIPLLCTIVMLGSLRMWQFFQTTFQQKFIVYNVAQKQAIDIINGRNFQFIGDSDLMHKGFMQNFHLLPSRILHQASFYSNLPLNNQAINEITIDHNRFLLLDKTIDIHNSDTVNTEFLIVSKNVVTPPSLLLRLIHCKEIILDGSNNRWRINQWKIAADSLHLRLHSVQNDGAFEMEL